MLIMQYSLVQNIYLLQHYSFDFVIGLPNLFHHYVRLSSTSVAHHQNNVTPLPLKNGKTTINAYDLSSAQPIILVFFTF